MIRAVVFDFDGVLVDSNSVKRDAYFRIFEEAGPVARGTIERTLASAHGGNRFSTIEMILKHLDPDSTPSELESGVARFARMYNDICEDYAATCPEVLGASASIALLSDVLPLYIASATPEEPLRRIVGRRGWDRYFQGIFGSPREKSANLQLIFSDADVGPGSILFVGDGARDLEAARQTGCHFLAVRNPFNDFDLANLPVVDDLSTLPELVHGWNAQSA